MREGGDAEDKDSGAAAMKHQATSLALVISVLVLGLAGCGGGDEEAASAPTGETTTTETTTSEAPGPAPELTPEPKDLVLQLSDLPTGYSIDPDETGPRSLSEALEDATPEEAALIRKERVGSYEVTFNSPNLRVISCTATVYRTSDAAAQIYRRGLERVQEPVKEGEPQLEPASLDDSLGDEAAAFTGESDGVSIFTILWRDRNVLALCATGGLIATDPAETVRVARAQQERIAEALR